MFYRRLVQLEFLVSLVATMNLAHTGGTLILWTTTARSYPGLSEPGSLLDFVEHYRGGRLCK